MHLKSIAAIISIFHFVQTNGQKCDKIMIGKEYYRRQLVATIEGYPSGITVDPRTENIFFVLHKRNYTKGLFLIKHGSLGVKEIAFPEEVFGQCVGIDDSTIYIGTNQGIVTYDYSRISTDRPIGDDDVRSIFVDKVNNEMYITTGSGHDIFKFINGSAAVQRYDRIPKAYSFVLDAKGNAFYEYLDGRLYFFSNDLFEPIQYKGLTKELKYILRMNNHDEAIVAVKGSMYKLTANDIIPKKIGKLGFKITGMTFDHKHNIYLGTKGKIYRYKPLDSNDPCPSEDYFMTGI